MYGCVGLLADSVASLPLRSLDKPAHLMAAQETEMPLLLESPYEPISVTDWLVMFIWSLALRGNFFGQIVDRDRLGHPTQIMPVSPDIVRPEVRHPDGEVRWFFAGKPIKTEDVFHVRYQSMPGHLLGLNPIQVMAYPFGLAHVLDVHAEKTFANSADPRGVIQVKGALSEAATKQMIASWAAAHQGVHKSSLPAILTEDSEFKPITLSPADQQLLQLKKYSAEEISGTVFRIPPHMVGLNERSTSFGRGIEQQERGFVANTLAGYLVRVERALTACLPAGYFANFDITHRIRGTELERAQTASLLMLAGVVNGDEARGRFFDMSPLPKGEGKFVNVPINTELLQKQLLEIQQMKEQPEPEPQQPPAASNGKGNPKNVPVPAR